MDRDEAFDRLETILRHFETANQLLLSEGIIEKDEDFSEENAYLNKAREALDYLAKQSPVHHAIPEEVRETLMASLKDGSYFLADLHPRERGRRVEAARDWLAKCPTATDRAVCPRCKKSFYPCEETVRYFICSCGQAFNIRVIVESYIPDAATSLPCELKDGGK